MFKLFSQNSPNRVFWSIVLGAFAGFSYSMLIPLILKSLSPKSSLPKAESANTYLGNFLEVADYKFAALFGGVCLLILIARTASQVMLSRVAINVTSQLRKSIYDRVAAAPLSALERVGSSRLIAVVTSDVTRVSMGARMLPELLINSVTLVGMLGFLLYLNPDVFYFVIGCIIFGIVTYQIPVFFSKGFYVRSRTHYDSLQEAIRGLIYGAKELKLNEKKRQAFFDNVLHYEEHEVINADKTGSTILQVASNYGGLLSFFAIGAVSFLFINYHAISKDELLGVIMALLYVTGPVTVLLNFIPQYSIALVSFKRIGQVFDDLEQETFERDIVPADDWSKVRFEQVKYSYPASAKSEGFCVGPLDFEINRGEITFIVGGNGSGKSTISKLLTLHYPISEGTIYFDDNPVNSQTVNSFRQEISAIYSDYYLFDRILDQDGREDTATMVHQYLEDLGIGDKVKYENNRFSTLALSDGQKRRLALLVAFMENKKFYLFDEWAADQDPMFKEVFYHKILPDMKAKGKAVVVISHDDRYFDVADRVLVMEEGKMVKQEVKNDSSDAAKSEQTEVSAT